MGQQERNFAHSWLKNLQFDSAGFSLTVDAKPISCSTVSWTAILRATLFWICDVALASAPLVDIDLRGAILEKVYLVRTDEKRGVSVEKVFLDRTKRLLLISAVLMNEFLD